MVIVPIFLLSGALALFSSPWAEAQMRLLIQKDAQTADIRGITAGRFSEYSHGDVVVYVQSISKDEGLTAFLYRIDNMNKFRSSMPNQVDPHLDDGRYCRTKANEFKVWPGIFDVVVEKFEKYASGSEKSLGIAIFAGSNK